MIAPWLPRWRAVAQVWLKHAGPVSRLPRWRAAAQVWLKHAGPVSRLPRWRAAAQVWLKHAGPVSRLPRWRAAAQVWLKHAGPVSRLRGKRKARGGGRGVALRGRATRRSPRRPSEGWVRQEVATDSLSQPESVEVSHNYEESRPFPGDLMKCSG